MEIKNLPRIMTIAEWFKKYPSFDTILTLADSSQLLDPLFSKTTPIGYKHLYVFNHILTMYGSRPVIPQMQFDSEKDSNTIEKISSIIQYRANMVLYKYNMLSETLFPNISDYSSNYQMSRNQTKTHEFSETKVTHSGDDTVNQKQDIKTENYVSTDDLANPRFEGYKETKTNDPQSGSNNEVKTSYGHIISSKPGTETERNTTSASGYYNSGTKAKMIEEMRKVLNYDIIDMWVQDILPSFTYSYYMTNRDIPAEFLL